MARQSADRQSGARESAARAAVPSGRDGAAVSCVYVGRVRHQRFRPFRHRLAFRVYSLFVDLDELPALAQRLACFSHNRWNLWSFDDRDHGPRTGAPLRPWIEHQLGTAGIDIQGGPVRLLCFPRVLGHTFNPLSIWFCHHKSGRLAALLYEVHNTFGEQHSYLLPVAADHVAGAPLRQQCPKSFYVSPFITMQATYDFYLSGPAEKLSVAIRQRVREGRMLVATQTGRRAGLRDGVILRLLFSHPFLTLKVILGIHWHGLRLWLKGARFFSRPGPPDRPVTLIAPASPGAAPALKPQGLKQAGVNKPGVNKPGVNKQ